MGFPPLAYRLANWQIYRYVPQRHTDCNQLGFHESGKTFRFISSGNRGGKTTVALAELAALLIGEPYPWWFKWENPPRRPETDVIAWLVITSFPKSPETDSRLRKLFFGDSTIDERGDEVKLGPLIPEEIIESRASDYSVVKLVNGNLFELKTDRQDTRAKASGAVDLIVIDEPVSDRTWSELLARMISKPGSRMIQAATDVHVFSEYLQTISASNNNDVDTFYFDTRSNKYVSRERIDTISALMPEQQRRTRIAGQSRLEQLLVYKNTHRWIDEDGSQVPSPDGKGNWRTPIRGLPKHWTRYAVHDPAISGNAAVVFFAVDEDDNIWCEDLIYWMKGNDRTLSDIAKQIIEHPLYQACGNRVYIDPYGCNASVNQTWGLGGKRSILSVYRDNGLDFKLPPKNNTHTIANRIARLREYFSWRNQIMAPMMWILDKPSMLPLKSELSVYRFKDDAGLSVPSRHHEKPVGDHDAIYCLEVAAVMRFHYQGIRTAPKPAQQILGIESNKLRNKLINQKP